MKFVLSCFLACVSLVAYSQTVFQSANVFFGTYVKNGKVDYSAINYSDINHLENLFSTTNIIGWSKVEKKAFYINAYNFYVIKLVVENYPVNSPMHISGFFSTKKINVAGNLITLDELENKILRKEFNDARLHFALVCGAVGCPVIINEAYFPFNLNDLLDKQTSLAINDTNFILLKLGQEEVEVSEIFNWYAEDFIAQSGSILAFINEYRLIKIPEHYRVTYYPYDWSLNDLRGVAVTKENFIQTFTSGSLLKKDQTELVVFNSLYSETKSNWMEQNRSGFRTTFVSSLVQFTYGISKTAKFNLGFDLNVKASASNSDASWSNITKPFTFKNNDSTRFGVAYLAPRVRWMPFKKLSNFTVQSSYFFILPKSPEGNNNLYWIEWDRHIWWNQFFYTKMFGQDRFQLFSEMDLLFRFAKSTNQHFLMDIPVSLFLSYFLNSKITFYLMSQHTNRFVVISKSSSNTDWPINANFTSSGVGAKYQLANGLNLELLYTTFWNAKNAGFGKTFNLGLRWVH